MPSEMYPPLLPLQNYIRTTVWTTLQYKFLTFFWSDNFYLRIMFPNKPNSFRGLFANNNALRLSQHHTKQSTDSRRSRTNDKHRVFFGNLRNASSPKSCSKDISYKQSLLITHGIGNEIQALISIRYANILRLPPSIRHPKAHPPLESAQLFTYPCRQKNILHKRFPH